MVCVHSRIGQQPLNHKLLTGVQEFSQGTQWPQVFPGSKDQHLEDYDLDFHSKAQLLEVHVLFFSSKDRVLGE